MSKQPSPKTDAMRALREERFNARAEEIRQARDAAAAEKSKPVKRKRGKE